MAYNDEILLPRVYDELVRLHSKLADEVAHALHGIDPTRGHHPSNLVHHPEEVPTPAVVPSESVAAPVLIVPDVMPTSHTADIDYMPDQAWATPELAPPADDAHVAVGSSLFSDPTKLKEEPSAVSIPVEVAAVAADQVNPGARWQAVVDVASPVSATKGKGDGPSDRGPA